MKRFVSPGDIVVVKPNMGWDRAPEFGANTHPAIVAALVGLAVEAGAKKVKVFDHTVNDPRRCYRQSGVAAAAESAGAEVVDPVAYRTVLPAGNAQRIRSCLEQGGLDAICFTSSSGPTCMN